jgi:hypothetical protein
MSYLQAEKELLVRKMLGDEGDEGLVTSIPVPENLWVYTPGRRKLLMGATRIETVFDLWGLDRMRPRPRAVVPMVSRAMGGRGVCWLSVARRCEGARARSCRWSVATRSHGGCWLYVARRCQGTYS